MEDNSADVGIGRLIGEYSYLRRSGKWRELELEGIKIDHFDPISHTVKEVKKSPKLEKAHIAQVMYYMYRLEQEGINHPSGLIEYPNQRRSVKVQYDDDLAKVVTAWIDEINLIISNPDCPDVIRTSYCKKCAFYDFCFC